jgi:hypothetical protein
MVLRHAELAQHFEASLDHQWWTAKIIFRASRVRMVAKMFLHHNFVNEPLMARPPVLYQWGGERKVESKVAMLLR